MRESACSARLDRGCRGHDRTELRGTPRVKHKDLRPWLSVIAGGESLVSHAGGVLLVETARRSGLAGQLSRLLGPWRRAVGGARSGQDRVGSGDRGRVGRGRRLRHRGVARPAGGVRPGGLGPDGVAADHDRWPRMPTRRWPRSARPARWRGNGCGSMPGRRSRTGGW